MTLPVKLADVVEQLSIVSESISVYLNRRTGEFVVLSSDDTLGFEDEYDFAQATSPDEPDWLEDEPEWSKEEHRLRREILNSSDYIPLPDKFDIHDWQIMEDFCRSVRKNPLREQLLGLIKGKGAFGRFNSAIRTFGIDNAWLEFREQAYRRIAVDWLEENEIGFIDDCQFRSCERNERREYIGWQVNGNEGNKCRNNRHQKHDPSGADVQYGGSGRHTEERVQSRRDQSFHLSSRFEVR